MECFASAEKVRDSEQSDFDIGTEIYQTTSSIDEEHIGISPAIRLRSGSGTFDLVPCLKFKGWPVISKEWQNRERI